MRIERKLAMLLTMLLILLNVFPAFSMVAQEIKQPTISFYAELAPNGVPPGLYGAIEELPVGITEVFIEYSIDGESFERFTGKTWYNKDIEYLEPSYGQVYFQLFMEMDESPLKECLENGRNLFIRACAMQSDTNEMLRSEPQEISLLPPPIILFAEYSEDEEPSGLYGFIGDIPKDTKEVFLEYSLDGESFERFEGKGFDGNDISQGWLPWQLLMGADEAPLKDCLERGDSSIFLRICAEQPDDEKSYSETQEISLLPRNVEIPDIQMELFEEGEAPGLYGSLSYIPENILSLGVEYSFNGEDYFFVDGSVWNSEELSQTDFLIPQLLIPINQEPLSTYLGKTVSSLYIRFSISLWDADDIRTEAVRLTHNEENPLPEELPFSAEIVYERGYIIRGHFEDFPSNAARVRPEYSLDGENYQYVNEPYSQDWQLEHLGTEDPKKLEELENQPCTGYYDEPLVGYVLGRLDQFYIRLEITAANGDISYTQAAAFSREAVLQTSDNVVIKAALPVTMRQDEDGTTLNVPYGQFRVTARTDATPEQLYGLLPDTLPVEVQFLHKDTGKLITSGIVQCVADWKTPPSFALNAGQTLTIPDAVGKLTVPAGAEVVTPLGKYVLAESLTPTDTSEVRLVIDAIGADTKPDVALRYNHENNTRINHGYLSLAFWQKPSEATSIEAFSYVDKDGEWTPICDLLDRRDVNYNQSAGLYGYVNVLPPDNPILQGYLNGTISGFGIGLKIKGGTFDGETVTLSWPGEYVLPKEISDIRGSEGNEGNAGSGDGSGDSNEDGQRPDLPTETPQPTPKPSPTPRPGGNKPNGGGTIIVVKPTPKPDAGGGVIIPTKPELSAPPPVSGDKLEKNEVPVKSNDNKITPSLAPSAEIPKTSQENEVTREKSPTESNLLLISTNMEIGTVTAGQRGASLSSQRLDSQENIASSPSKSETGEIASTPAWSETSSQEVPKIIADEPAEARVPTESENNNGVPWSAGLILLGGGVAVVGVTATGAAGKLIVALKKLFFRK